MSRQRYRLNPETKQLEEVPGDYVGGDRHIGVPVTDLYMDGVRATDGTDIGSRRKRREYMRAHDLVDAGDYTNTWAKKSEERAALARGEVSQAQRREVRASLAEAIQRANGTRRR